MLHVAGIKSLGILNLEEMNKKLTDLLIPDGKRTEAEKSDDQKQLASALVTRLEETLDQAKATASRLSKLEGMYATVCLHWLDVLLQIDYVKWR